MSIAIPARQVQPVDDGAADAPREEIPLLPWLNWTQKDVDMFTMVSVGIPTPNTFKWARNSDLYTHRGYSKKLVSLYGQLLRGTNMTV